MPAADTDYRPLLKAAKAAARAAGAIIRRDFGRRHRVRKKGAVNLVTETDMACEREIVMRLRRRFPDHAVLAEEEGKRRGGPEFLWIVDPLDGTTNFAHDYPQVAVSLALRHRRRTVLAVAYDPLRDELFHAVKGRGAWLGRRRLQVTDTRRCDDGLVALGFPYNRRPLADRLAASVEIAITNFQGVRRAGAAVLDFCWVACGRLDAYFEEQLKPWDMAAGALLVQEAGGRVTDFAGRACDPWTSHVLATNRKLHREAVRLLAPVLRRINREGPA